MTELFQIQRRPFTSGMVIILVGGAVSSVL